MATIRFTNNASTNLLSTIDAAATEFTVTPGTGSLFPTINPVNDEYFICTIIDPTGAFEIVKCTARVEDRFTCIRGTEGTSAKPFEQGSVVELRLTAEGINWIADRVGNIENIIGLESDGTSFNLTDNFVLKIVQHDKFKHKTTHSTSGTDAVTPVSIGAARGDASGNAINANKWGGSAIFRSTAAPSSSAGAVNDVWFQYFA